MSVSTDQGGSWFEVDCILDKRSRHGTTEYLIHWQGYSSVHDTWEPERNLRNIPELVAEFEKMARGSPQKGASAAKRASRSRSESRGRGRPKGSVSKSRSRSRGRPPTTPRQPRSAPNSAEKKPFVATVKTPKLAKATPKSTKATTPAGKAHLANNKDSIAQSVLRLRTTNHQESVGSTPPRVSSRLAREAVSPPRPPSPRALPASTTRPRQAAVGSKRGYLPTRRQWPALVLALCMVLALGCVVFFKRAAIGQAVNHLRKGRW